MDAQNVWIKRVALAAVGVWLLALAGAWAYTQFGNKDSVLKPVRGDVLTVQYCKNIRDGLKLENGDEVTVTQLVQMAGSDALKDPSKPPSNEAERKALNKEKPYYTSGLFLALMGEFAVPAKISDASAVIRQTMTSARTGVQPTDQQAALDAAQVVDRFIASKCGD